MQRPLAAQRSSVRNKNPKSNEPIKVKSATVQVRIPTSNKPASKVRSASVQLKKSTASLRSADASTLQPSTMSPSASALGFYFSKSPVYLSKSHSISRYDEMSLADIGLSDVYTYVCI